MNTTWSLDESMPPITPARLNAWLDACPAVLYRRKPTNGGGLIFISDNINHLFGYAPQDLTSDAAFWLERIHPDDRERVRTSPTVLMHDQPALQEYRFQHRDGSYRWVRDTCRLLQAADGTPSEMVGTLYDITAQGLADETGSELNRQVDTNSGQDLLDGMAQSVAQRLAADLVIIGERAADGTTIRALAVCLNGQRVPGFLYALAGTPCEQVVTGAFRLFPEQVRTQFPNARALTDHAIESYAGTPLRGGDNRVLGVLCAMSRRPLTHGLDFRKILDAVAIRAAAIIERLRAESALREQKREFQTLVENSPDVIARFDRNFCCLYCSPAMRQVTGRPTDACLGKSTRELDFPAELADRWDAAMRQTFEGRQVVRFDFACDSAKGRRYYDALVVPECAATGAIDTVMVISRNMTDRKNEEEQRRKLERQVQRQQKHHIESIGILAGGVAHDFNNLLMTILGNAEILGETLPDDPDLHACVAEISRASQHAADLCRQMLAYAGKGRYVVETLDLTALLRHMQGLLQAALPRHVTLTCQLAENLPALEGDATQVKEVIMNLLTNAGEALGKAAGIITISTGVVQADDGFFDEGMAAPPPPPGTYVYVDVQDTGCGMDKELLPRIFDPFFSTKFPGRGLGLAAVYGIVLAHKGAIQVFSKPGCGTRVVTYFPAVATGGKSPEATPGTATRKRLILVVDDEEPVRTVLARFIRRCGYVAVIAADGETAVQMFREHAADTACVLLDLYMPMMDGVEVMGAMRAMRPDIPIVISSGYNEAELERRFAGLQVSGFLQKPYNLALLTAKLRSLLGDLPDPIPTLDTPAFSAATTD